MSVFQLKLLEKVEELTLYTLTQDEQIKTQIETGIYIELEQDGWRG